MIGRGLGLPCIVGASDLKLDAKEKKLVAPWGTMERYRLIEWLNFITSELHKGFSPLFTPGMPEEAKALARTRLLERFQWVDAQLADINHYAERYPDAFLDEVEAALGGLIVAVAGLLARRGAAVTLTDCKPDIPEAADLAAANQQQAPVDFQAGQATGLLVQQFADSLAGGRDAGASQVGDGKRRGQGAVVGERNRRV